MTEDRMKDTNKTQNPHIHHRQRLKRRFSENGLSSFEDHNVLELLLFFAIPNKDTNVTAHRLLDRFLTISGVFDASPEELMQVNGIGEHAATLIKLIPQLAKRYVSDRNTVSTEKLTYEQVGEYFKAEFTGDSREGVVGLLLDNALNIISCERFAEGNINSAALSFRDIAEKVISRKASYVILAHNHPKGLPLASFEDMETTRRLKGLFSQIEVELIDHFIIAEGRCSSIDREHFHFIMDSPEGL